MQYTALRGLSDDLLKALINEAQSIIKARKLRLKQDRKKKSQSSEGSARENFIQNKNAEIVEYNSSSFLMPPRCNSKRKVHAGLQYLPSLLRQDWSYLFKSESYSKEKIFYVYAHVNPETPRITASTEAGGVYAGTPFYIGKGTGDRAYDLKRNQGHGKILKQLTDKNYTKDHIVKIIFDNLDEATAYEIESKLIYFFGTVYGHSRGVLYNLDTPPVPKFSGYMKPMDLNIQDNSVYGGKDAENKNN